MYIFVRFFVVVYIQHFFDPFASAFFFLLELDAPLHLQKHMLRPKRVQHIQ